jgi:hypothetical protein
MYMLACHILLCLSQATCTSTCATATAAQKAAVLLVPGLAATAPTWSHNSRMKPQQQQQQQMLAGG